MGVPFVRTKDIPSPSHPRKEKEERGKGLVYGGWKPSLSRLTAQASRPDQPSEVQPLRGGPLLARHRPNYLQPCAPQQRFRLLRRAPSLPPARHVAGRPRHDRQAVATGPGQGAAQGGDCRLQHRVGVRHSRGRGLCAPGPVALVGASRRLRRGRGLAPGSGSGWRGPRRRMRRTGFLALERERIYP
ncbi:hypothetical protein CGRA01v4_05241 [Colletotrichum graminicola]|nr:hypothetical protein CGRA01v4_05241 [Colletotrichum graminicola]